MPVKSNGKAMKTIALVLTVLVAFGAMAPAAFAADRIENKVTSYPKTYFTAVKAQGSSGAKVTLSTTREVSHTVSGSIGISVSVVTASIGYAYNTSESVTYSYSRSAPLSSRCYRINAYDNFRRDSFKWIEDIPLLPDRVGNSITQDHLSVSYTTSDYAKPSSGC